MRLVPKTHAAALLLAPLLGACLATPPAERRVHAAGVVRAPSASEAAAVGALLDELRPQVEALVPGARRGQELEVWIQDVPRLYRFPEQQATSAEGLYAERHDLILLARDAEDRRRTLAHELTHAALGGAWRALPGSLEEGLCDHVSECLSPAGGARLRAGRLSSAALACGGLTVELELRVAGEPAAAGAPDPPWAARVVLAGAEPGADAHLDVFRVRAGLSSSKLSAPIKRGFYGLSYLVVDRIAARIGLAGLHELCARAEREGHRRVPEPWLLAAAELGEERDAWRRAAAEAFDAEALVELLRMYPEFAVDALAAYVLRLPGDASVERRLERVAATLSLPDGDVSVRIERLPFVRDALRRRLALVDSYWRRNE